MPDDLLTLLHDPYLFSGSSEITTKEILKRFQDRRGQMPIPEISEVYNRQEIPSRSPPKRVETDPSLWQAERTVRPVQDPPAPFTSMSRQNTPPQRWRNPDDQPSPYSDHHYNRSETHLSHPDNEQNWQQNSAWGRHPGGLGVGGNS